VEVRKTELLETLADRFLAQIKFLKPAVEGAPTHAELDRILDAAAKYEPTPIREQLRGKGVKTAAEFRTKLVSNRAIKDFREGLDLDDLGRDVSFSRRSGKGGDIPVNKSLWILPNGDVVDVSVDGALPDGSAFSHGIYVKQWVAARLEFHPNKKEAALARRIKQRADELMAEDTTLRDEIDPDSENLLADDPEFAGFFDETEESSPFAGDLAYNQAAVEHGWVRVKPASFASERTLYVDTLDGHIPSAAAVRLRLAAAEKGYTLEILTGGPINNRVAFQRPASTVQFFRSLPGQDEFYSRRSGKAAKTAAEFRTKLVQERALADRREGLRSQGDDVQFSRRGQRKQEDFYEMADKNGWLLPNGEFMETDVTSAVTVKLDGDPLSQVGNHARAALEWLDEHDPDQADIFWSAKDATLIDEDDISLSDQEVYDFMHSLGWVRVAQGGTTAYVEGRPTRN
jgi:hypothetical protein